MKFYRMVVTALVTPVVYLARLLLLGAAAALYVYFLPSLVAERRKLPRTQAVFLWNLAAGWLVIPWVIALVLAYTMDPVPQSTA